MTRSTPGLALFLGLALTLSACGGDAPPATDSDAPAPAAGSDELTAIELEQGIGPIRDVELGTLDPALAAQGEEIFTTKCSACHKLGERYVAPALGEVLSRRRPEYVMNMMLNAGEMVERHPVVRELLAEFYTPMPVQLSDPAQARAVLEYLRSAQTGPSAGPGDGAGQS